MVNRVSHLFDCIPMASSFRFDDGQTTFYNKYINIKQIKCIPVTYAYEKMINSLPDKVQYLWTLDDKTMYMHTLSWWAGGGIDNVHAHAILFMGDKGWDWQRIMLALTHNVSSSNYINKIKGRVKIYITKKANGHIFQLWAPNHNLHSLIMQILRHSSNGDLEELWHGHERILGVL